MNTMNLERVAALAARECIRQHVGIERLSTLLKGYEHAAKHIKTREGLIERGYEELTYLAGIVEPDNNGRFRNSPVTFRDGGTAARASEIERLLFSLYAHGDALTAEEWTKQFLWIHPFVDGNGRTGWVLYNLLNGTLDDPLPLPEFF